MKIIKLIYQTYLPHQGRYPRVSGQARILKRSGFDVKVIACDREGGHRVNDELEGIKVERISQKTKEMRGPLRQFFPLVMFWIKTLRKLSSSKYDILHCHNIDVLPLGCAVKFFFGRPVVFESHEPDYYALWPKRWDIALWFVNFVEKMMVRYLDNVSVTNQIQVDKYLKMGVKNVRLIGNYPVPELRVQALDYEKFKRPFVTFGRIGTIYADTGFEQSVEAFSKITEKYPESRFFIAGRVFDNYKDKFLSIIKPFEKNIDYAGAFSADRMPELYGKIDVSLLVYPRSRWFKNITPRKFFDSIANGVPVIMTDIGDLGDYINHKNCGIVVDENRIESVCRAMEKMIEKRDFLKKTTLKSFALGNTEFGWSRMATLYVNMQRDVIKKK